MSRFIVASDPSRPVIRVSLHGLLDLTDVAALKIAQAAEVRDRCYAAGRFDAIIDVADAPIQSQAVARALNDLPNDPAFSPRRIGFVVGQSAARLQIRRVGRDHNAYLCTSQEEAESWLADTLSTT